MNQHEDLSLDIENIKEKNKSSSYEISSTLFNLTGPSFKSALKRGKTKFKLSKRLLYPLVFDKKEMEYPE